MKSRHTPGPWRLETAPTSVGYCHKIGPWPIQSIRKETYACIYHDNYRPDYPDGELLANARLMVAAPEQYDALLTAPSPFSDLLEFMEQYEEWYNGPRAVAIIKAESGQ